MMTTTDSMMVDEWDRGFGEADASTGSKAIWLGIAGLALSATLMIAMGFHKTPQYSTTTYRRRR
jgi:hypothetical protein